VGPYRIKSIILANAVELELPSTIKISLVVNVSRIKWYIDHVDGQRQETLQPVIVEEEKEWEVERILNKRNVSDQPRAAAVPVRRDLER